MISAWPFNRVCVVAVILSYLSCYASYSLRHLTRFGKILCWLISFILAYVLGPHMIRSYLSLSCVLNFKLIFYIYLYTKNKCFCSIFQRIICTMYCIYEAIWAMITRASCSHSLFWCLCFCSVIESVFHCKRTPHSPINCCECARVTTKPFLRRTFWPRAGHDANVSVQSGWSQFELDKICGVFVYVVMMRVLKALYSNHNNNFVCK